MYKKYFKRVLDLTISIFLLLFSSPLLVICTIALFFTNRGTPFFFQKRPGENESLFTIIKFKTMNDLKDMHGNLLSDEERLSAVGKIIRKLSIDELPQLFNVIKGDMSLIGPRPLLIEYLPLYNDSQKRRHEVKPGITGWAQVNGRNAISWGEKFELDVWYVDNIIFRLDMWILLLTIKKIAIIDGINSRGYATAPKYNGNN